ncbi:uncharacterized protein MELLADRAFT_102178 [Melampsora larici-populina 98AG31]|uniref:Uncharacterized protein n=1 Tax=Melampsora larici-populina (strain 98AG31 / pathotype 3-4-7) TaxID=747676 RepID=F4R7F9_MELLP|nr:uncharacterized protein MELLADRAFT_102178 [Melampsora larici-populina 98AG31]EGG11793.1 hypothetical protein MELLADRAFT_102178 [Melampsora larici-populina 98AG31]
MSTPCKTAAHQIYHQMRMACPVCGIPSAYMDGFVSADMVDILQTKIGQSFTHATLPVPKTHRSKATQGTVYPHQKSKLSQIRPPTPYPGTGAGLQELIATTKLDDPQYGLHGNLEDVNQGVSNMFSSSGIGVPLSNENDIDMTSHAHTLATLQARVNRLVPRIVRFSPGNARLRKRFMEMTSKICLPCLNPQNSDSQTSLSECLEVNPNKEVYNTTNAMLRRIKDRLNGTKPRIVRFMPTNERLRDKFSALREGRMLRFIAMGQAAIASQYGGYRNKKFLALRDTATQHNAQLNLGCS